MLDRAALALSRLSGGGALPAVVVGALAWRRSRSARHAVAAALPVEAAYLLSIGLSRALGRPRPCRQAGVVPLTDCPDGPSLPSDQAAAAVAALAINRRVGTPTRVALGALALATGAARPYAGLHYPGDVLAGAALGAICGRALRMPALRLLHAPRPCRRGSAARQAPRRS
jgi:membrane-associated phospholipid phosphatase